MILNQGSSRRHKDRPCTYPTPRRQLIKTFVYGESSVFMPSLRVQSHHELFEERGQGMSKMMSTMEATGRKREGSHFFLLLNEIKRGARSELSLKSDLHVELVAVALLVLFGSAVVLLLVESFRR